MARPSAAQLDQARQVLKERGRISASVLQSVLGVGFTTAFSLCEKLEAEGTVRRVSSLPPPTVWVATDE